MIQISEKAILVAGTPVQPFAFAELITRHPQGIGKAVSLEAEARCLIAAGFSQERLTSFLGNVCAWGGYPRTADRVLGGNTFPEIQRRFRSAVDALAKKEPDIKSALREIKRVRYLGVSFASKHLRLFRPDVCPVLDSFLSEKLGYPLNAPGYKRFAQDCLRVAELLQKCRVRNPVDREDGAWYAADVEMALFVYVKEQFTYSHFH
jgi:hypothetical protein